ncbi:LOW QUALITY PROTEIN: zinc finger MYM-type protein 1-like [Bombina bombina]|uniref:LOW QUALITY PROTEIN: zinc finger MYM-type protein 1-like n=1 Tax=Bombina bombina TaxID=8345 RepID=UPI00235A4A76|nr:LOW QUALITY PROTEIN: zinc finger MYM-type protein 1-like [Bombina bombina]
MPHAVHKSKRPSGCQQRKAKEARTKSIKTLAGSMLQYVKRPDDGQGSSKDTACQSPIDIADSSDAIASMHSAEEQEVEMAESEVEEQGAEIAESEAEESAESDSSHSHDTVKEMIAIKEKDFQILSDVSFWEIPVPDHFRVEIIKKGSASFQNKDGPFSVVKRPDAKAEIKGAVRQLSKERFYKMMPNGEKILRSWMVYSPVSENLYCFCCRLFAISATDTISKFVTGFQKWWKLNPKVHNHETSEDHLRCLENWKTLAAGLKMHKTIDAENIALMEIEKKKCRDILHRLLDITLFLAKQNLAFRGHKEDESSFNKGNFLEMVEMLSKYDSVLKEHLIRLKRSTCKLKVSVSYLAPKTQNEFISVLANHVKEKLVMEIKSAKYFGIMFDSTPDISHTDQMSEVIRYVKISNRKVEVKEVFLGFFPLKGKKAADLSSEILKKMESDGLDIMMCRAQGYDNAATMAGKHGGVQSILKEKNKKAIFNGCVDHSLNLCGQHSFAENASCVTFFGTLQTMFSFFSASTHRWDVLIDHTGMSVKRLSTTRWSAHHAAVKPVKEKFDKFVEAIGDLCDPDENLETRGAAQVLLNALSDFTFLCYLYFWSDVLQEVNDAQQYLQTKGLSLDKVVTKLETLRLFLYEERIRLVENAIEQALLKSEEYGIAVERRARFKKRMPGEQARDAGLSLQEENKRGMLECIDRFHSEIQNRSRAIMEVAGMFEAVQAKSLISATEEELKVSIPKLSNFYDEVSESELFLEIPRLRRHLKAAQIDLEEVKDWATLEVLTFIAKWDFIESLPTLSLSLKLFLTICVSVASCERSFSKLKLIKNYLRSTMGQSRLSDLSILSIESDLAKDIDFHEVINNFAALKARKAKF